MALGHKEFLAQVPGLTLRQLDHWTRQGWLNALAGTAPRNGGRTRLWPESYVDIARLMLRLVAAGFSAQRAHGIATVWLGATSRFRANDSAGVVIGDGLTLRIDAP